MSKLTKKAFTLAEVLITLGIIGVVAALTIPALVKNYQKTQTVTLLKKTYTQFNQVLLRMASDNGTPDSIADYFGSNANQAGDVIASYYKLTKNCKTSTSTTDRCFADWNQHFDGSGSTVPAWYGWFYKFITSDGASILVDLNTNSSCKTNLGFATANSPTYNGVCTTMYIDINGIKGPNFMGKDVFQFYITNGRGPLLYPVAGFYSSWSWDLSGSLTTGGTYYWKRYNGCSAAYTGGDFCSARIIEKGWVIDYY